MKKQLLLISFIGGMLCLPAAFAVREKKAYGSKEAAERKAARFTRKRARGTIVTPERLERKKGHIAFWKEVIEGLKVRGEAKNAEYIKLAKAYLKRAEDRLAILEDRFARVKKMHKAGSLTRRSKKAAREEAPKVYDTEPKEISTTAAS